MNTAKISAPITAKKTARLTLPFTSPAMYEENWKPMYWKSTTLARPARPTRPSIEKSGLPSEKPALVAASIIALDEVPRAGKALFNEVWSTVKAPMKLIATEIMAKMVRPITTLWKVRVFKIEMPAITSIMMIPTIILLALSCSQFGALAKALPGKATPIRSAVSWTLCVATMISKPLIESADPTSVQLSIQPQNRLMIREVKT